MEGHTQSLFLLGKEGSIYPNYATNNDECSTRHGHHTVVYITKVVDSIGNDAQSEQSATTKEFSHCTHNHEYGSITQSITNTIQE